MMESKEELFVKGPFHTLKYSNNILWAMGNNQFGQLGIGKSETASQFIQCSILLRSEEEVIQIALNFNHSFVLTNHNRLFVCGQNSFGQLGLNHFDNQIHFVECKPSLKEGEAITQMALGHHHSLLLTNQSRVFGSGFNFFGQLGLLDNTIRKEFTPCELSLFENEKIEKMTAGFNYSKIKTTQNRIFACGDDRKGDLGLDKKIHLQFGLLNNNISRPQKKESEETDVNEFQSLALKMGLF